jgi:dipeptidyl aminopeptidase/acylaminoacyl peptidase
MEFKHYLSIRSAMGGSLRADGQRLAFLYNAAGTHQVYTMDAPLGWPSQRTFYANRVTFVDYAPKGNRYIFGMDEGGDEKDQFFLSADDGQHTEALTDDSSVKHIWGAWNDDGTRIAFTATRDNPTDFFAYTMDLNTKAVQKISNLGGYARVMDWRGSLVLVSRMTGNDNNDLYVIDLETGVETHLTPHEENVVYDGAHLDSSERFVYCSSNLNREFENIARINMATKQLEFLSERNWDEENFALTADDRFICISSNEAGLSVLEIRNLESGRSQRVTGLPIGTALVSPARDGQSFIVVANGASAAPNLFTLSIDGVLTPWTNVDLGLVPRESLVEPELVKWQSFDDLEISGWYYKPKDKSGLVPVVIIIHGGPESQTRTDFAPIGQYLVSKGMAVLYPNVRGSTGYGKTFMGLDDVRKRMDSVADIKAAVQWLTGSGGADPERIAVYGGSYGGFMVLSCLTTYPDLFAAGVDIVGISNFVTFLEKTSSYRRAVRESEYGSLEHDREFLESISPINHLDRMKAPLFIVHGANDPRVPLFEAEQMRDALAARGVPVEFLVYHDEGHGLAKLENRLDAYPKIATFLEQRLLR